MNQELESEIKLFKSLALKLSFFIFLLIWGYFMYERQYLDSDNLHTNTQAFYSGKELSCTSGGKTYIISNSKYTLSSNIVFLDNNKKIPLRSCSVIESFGEK